jgi:hypothetical protein
MSPGPLANQARSVYRLLLRASKSTFAGDKLAQTQFHSVIRTTFLSPTLTSPIPKSSQQPTASSCSSSATPAPTSSEPEEPKGKVGREEYLVQLDHWKDVAQILRQNIVQGERINKERRDQAERENEAVLQAQPESDLETTNENTDSSIYRKSISS